MRKEPKYHSKTYNSYYREGNSRSNDYDDNDKYKYDYENNQDQDFDSFYQSTGNSRWSNNKSQDMDYLNYKLPYKQDNKAAIKENFTKNSYSSNSNYNYYDKNFDERNDYNQYYYKNQNNNKHKNIYTQAYKEKDNCSYSHKARKFQGTNIGETVYQETPCSNYRTKMQNSKNKLKTDHQSANPQLKQHKNNNKPSTEEEINYNFGSKSQFVLQEELKKLNVKECFFRGDDRISEQKLNHKSSSDRVTNKAFKERDENKNNSNIKIGDKVCKSKKNKELFKIDEFDSDIETFDTDNLNIKTMPSLRGQPQTSLYYVNTVNLNPSSSLINNIPAVFNPQYVQYPIGQPNFIQPQSFQNQVVDPRIGFTGRSTTIQSNQTQPFISYMMPSMADPRVGMNQLGIISPSSQKFYSNINNYANLQSTFLNQEEQPQINLINYPSKDSSSINNHHMQNQIDNENYNRKTIQPAKDSIDKQNLERYAKYYQNLTQSDNASNLQNRLSLTKSNNELQDSSLLMRQFPSKPQIYSLMLGPKVSIRSQFNIKKEPSSNKEGVGIKPTTDIMESIQKDQKSENNSLLRLEGEENDYDQLTFLNSLQSEDHPYMTGIKDLVFTKEVEYENDFKSSLKNEAQVESSKQQEKIFSTNQLKLNQSLASHYISEQMIEPQFEYDSQIFKLDEQCCSEFKVSKSEKPCA